MVLDGVGAAVAQVLVEAVPAQEHVVLQAVELGLQELRLVAADEAAAAYLSLVARRDLVACIVLLHVDLGSLRPDRESSASPIRQWRSLVQYRRGRSRLTSPSLLLLVLVRLLLLVVDEAVLVAAIVLLVTLERHGVHQLLYLQYVRQLLGLSGLAPRVPEQRIGVQDEVPFVVSLVLHVQGARLRPVRLDGALPRQVAELLGHC